MNKLPTKFLNGEDFYDFVHNMFRHKDTYVECQDGSNDPDGAWVAQIGGDPLIHGATFGSGCACWYKDSECQEELTPEELKAWVAC